MPFDITDNIVAKWTELTAEKDYVAQNLEAARPAFDDGRIVFDGADDRLSGGLSDPISTQECLVGLVAADDSAQSGTQAIAGLYSGAGDNDLYYLRFGTVDGLPTAWYGNGSGAYETLQGEEKLEAGREYLWEFASDGNHRQLLMNKVVVAESTTNLFATASQQQFGASGTALHAKCSIGKFFAYGSAKTQAERQAIEAHCYSRYGISGRAPVPDEASPTVSDDTLESGQLFPTSVRVDFEEATDEVTPQEAIAYRLFYSTSANLDGTPAEIIANGIEADSGAGVSSLYATGLSEGTPYWLNLVGEDQSGNLMKYAQLAVTTPATEVSEFVSVAGTDFMVGGAAQKFVGTNAYYLPNYEIFDPSTVDEAFAAFEEADLNLVRMWFFYDGPAIWPDDSPMQPEPGVYDETALRGLDRVVAAGKSRGIYFLAPLVNYWQALGGIQAYLTWAGVPNPDVDSMTKFINNADCQQWFRDYVSMILNRVNTITGVAYKDEPAIMAWEIGNELRNPPPDGSLDEGDEIRDWYQGMAQYIKSIDPNHLVTTGEEGHEHDVRGEGTLYSEDVYSNDFVMRSHQGTSFLLNIEIPEIDFGSMHWYNYGFGFGEEVGPTLLADQQAWITDHKNIADAAGKPLLLGEYGYQGYGNEDQKTMYNDLWSICEDIGMQAETLWELTAGPPKDDEYGGNIVFPGGRRDTELFNDFKHHIYTQIGLADPDAPVVSNGALSIGSITDSSMEVSYNEASDSVYSGLVYELYWSESDNLSGTAAEIMANGTLAGEAEDETSITATGLPEGIEIFINVLARDGHGNRTAYSANSEMTSGTADTTPPTISTNAITPSNETETSVEIDFDGATDDVTDPGNLLYEVFRSTSDNLNTDATTVRANGTLVDSGAGLTNFLVPGLDDGTTYWINVIVSDERGNEAIYAATRATTLADTTAPTVTNPDVTFQAVTGTSFEAHYAKATDDHTPQANIFYELYLSTANNISTLAEIDANGALESDGYNFSFLNAADLTNGDTYYANIVATDLNGNRAVYTAAEVVLPDTAAPVLSGAFGAETGPSTADGSVTTDEADGTLYAVLTTSSSAPSNTQVKAGQDDSGAAAAYSDSQAIGSTGEKVFSATGLTAETSYYWHFMHEDSDANQSGVASSTAVTTEAAPDLMAHEFDPGGAVLAAGPDVSAWDDNLTAASMVPPSTADQPSWDGQAEHIFATGTNQNLFTDELDFTGDSCQISMAIDLSRAVSATNIVNLAAANTNDFADGGFQFNIANGTSLTFGYGANYIGDLAHSGKDSIVTMWYDGTTAYGMIDTFDGEHFEFSAAFPAHTVPTTTFTFNADAAAGAPTANSGSTDARIQAVRIWDDHGDAATRDARIAQMVTDYLT